MEPKRYAADQVVATVKEATPLQRAVLGMRTKKKLEEMIAPIRFDTNAVAIKIILRNEETRIWFCCQNSRGKAIYEKLSS